MGNLKHKGNIEVTDGNITIDGQPIGSGNNTYQMTLGFQNTTLNANTTYIAGGIVNLTAITLFNQRPSRQHIVPRSGNVVNVDVCTIIDGSKASPDLSPSIEIHNITQNTSRVITNTDLYGEGFNDLISEDFSGGLPSGWQITGTGTQWTIQNEPMCFELSNIPGWQAMACANSLPDTNLITPNLNIAGITNIELSFLHRLRRSFNEVGNLFYSTDNGVTWQLIQTFDTNMAAPDQYVVNLSSQLSGASTVMFRFNFTSSSFQYYWAVTNIKVSNLDSTLIGDSRIDQYTLTTPFSVDKGDIIQIRIVTPSWVTAPGSVWQQFHLDIEE